MESYLNTNNKEKCFGCEACKQICPKNAIEMITDGEGFRYPKIDDSKCINCGLCERVCPYNKMPERYEENKYVFGGYDKSMDVRSKSTSGGIFTSIVNSYCDSDYVIFGAASNGLEVYHTYITDKNEIDKFRRSKYSQSKINDSYSQVKQFLKENKKVLFSGTPCQIAGLKSYLGNANLDNLLTVEVICEGVPSPLYMEKMNNYLLKKYKSKIKNIDYRFKNMKKRSGKWDFEVMRIELENGKILKKDRWFNPFWKLWLEHLMSRPSCYSCPFANSSRVADITLGDLWGVHLYCPELYGKNGGSSLIICNTEKGKKIFEEVETSLYGHELRFEDALKYQGPMRKPIARNDKREEFMKDLQDEKLEYKDILKKWYKGPSIKLLYSKYIWGNRQKMFVWNLKNKGRR